MIASATFAVSVLLSRTLLQYLGSHCCSNCDRNKELTGDKGKPPDFSCKSTSTNQESMETIDAREQLNKKRKQPLSSRETLREGELEAADEAFTSALSALKSLSQSNVSTISPAFVAAQNALKVAKSRIHDLKKRKVAACLDPPSWSLYPPPCEVPRERGNPRFARSFDVASLLIQDESTLTTVELLQAEERVAGCRKEAQDFFDLYGFVVFSNVLSADECRATESEIWEYLEEKTPGLRRSDPSSHAQLSAKRYGLPDDQAIFTRQLVANRQSRRLYAALDCVTPLWAGCGPSLPERDAAGPNSVLVSHDRWCIYPPTQGAADRQTDNPPVHLDICPWTYLPEAAGGSRRHDPETDPALLRYDGDTRVRQLKDWRAEINCVRAEFGPHAQGVLALADNAEEDGGTVVVPAFHKVFRKWQASLGSWEANRTGQRRRGCSYNFHNPQDPIHKLARRVPIRAGSLLLWNQCTVHGAVPNRSDKFRVAQFVRGVRAGECGVQAGGESSARARARADAIVRELWAARSGRCEGEGPQLLPLAPHVLGITPDDMARGAGGTSTKLVSDKAAGTASSEASVAAAVVVDKDCIVEKHWNI